MAGILKLWLQSWQSVQTEALAAAQLAGNAGTSVGSKAFAFLNSVASSSTMGVAMLSVTLTTVVSTASVVYDVVLDPESPLQVQSVSFDSGIITDEEGNFIYNVETESQMFDLIQAVHNPDEEHTIFTPWEPETEQILNTGLSADELKEEEELPTNISSNGDNENIPPDDVITAAPLTDTEPRQTTNETNDTGIQRLIADSPPVVTLAVSDIIITRQPDAALEVSEGSIAGGLIVDARMVNRAAVLTYQWYQNTSASNTGGNAIPGATGHVLFIPTNLTQGTYYYYVVISSAGGTPVTSNVSVVTVTPATAPLHNLTILGGRTGATPSGMRAQGSHVEIHPGRQFGYAFTGFTVVSGGVNLIDYPTAPGFTNLPTHLFTMPANEVTLRANWVQITPKIEMVLQPISQNSVVGGAAGLLARASVNTGEPLTYQWYQSFDGTNTGGTPINDGSLLDNLGLTNAFLALGDPFTASGTFYYFVEVSSPGSPTIKSNVAVLTVNPGYNITVNSENAADAFAEHMDLDKRDHNIPFAKDDIIYISPGRRVGYVFKEWITSPANLAITLYNSLIPGSGEFKVPESDVTLTARWEEATTEFTVTLLEAGPTASARDMDDFEIGPFYQDTPIVVQPGTRPNHEFVGWTVTSGNVTLFDDMPGAVFFAMPGSNVTLTANWIKTPEVTIEGGGTGAFGTGFYAPGDVVQVNSGARSDGMIFMGFETNPSVDFTLFSPFTPPYPTLLMPETPAGAEFIMPAEDVTVTVIWAAPSATKFEVIVANGGDGAGAKKFDILEVFGLALPEYSPFSPGDPISIDAGTRPGFKFAGWTVTTNNVNFNRSDAETSFTMPADAVTVTANWVQVYNVTVVTSGNHFSIAVSGSGSYTPGDIVEINPGANMSGLVFASWESSDIPPSAFTPVSNIFPGTASFIMPAHNVTVTATWVAPGSAPMQLSLDLTDPPETPIGDCTEPPEPETGEPPTGDGTEPPEPPSGDGTEPPEPPSGDGTEPTEPPTDDTTEPPEPETGDPPEQGTTNPPDEPSEPPAEEPQD